MNRYSILIICLSIAACSGGGGGGGSGGSNSGDSPRLIEITPIGVSQTHTPAYTFYSSNDGGLLYSGSCVSNTTHAFEGENTVTFNYLSNGSYDNCKISLMGTDNNVLIELNVTSFEVIDTTPPLITQIKPIEAIIYDRTPSYEFASTEAGVITYLGDCISNTTTAVSGENIITFSLMSPTKHENCQIYLTDYEGNISNILDVNDFEVKLGTFSGKVDLTAWVGSDNSIVSFSDNADGLDFYRTTDKDCDFSDLSSCNNGEFSVVNGVPLTDNALTNNQEAFYRLDYSGNLSNITMVSSDLFSVRESHSLTVFKDQLLVIGGSGDNTERHDLWFSPDGKSWALKTNNLGFSVERNPQSVPFNGKIWVVGANNSNAVWSSIDGENWIEEIANAPFSARSGHRVVSFDNKLWIIGGGGYGNDIWSSVDGIFWVLEKEHAGFSPRRFHNVIVWNNKIWLIGGKNESGYFSDVWSSEDGVNWLEEADSTPYPQDEGVGHFVVYNNLLWRIGGGSFFAQDNEIWSTNDGVNWIKAASSTAFDKRYCHQVAVFNGKLWMIGGIRTGLSSTPWFNDIWTSINGIDWEQVTTIESDSFIKRSEHQSVVFKDKLFIVGGRVGFLEKASNDVWSSLDGISWQQDVAHTNFKGIYRHKIVKFKDKLWIIGGVSDDNRTNDVWSSDDGINWTLVNNNPGFSERDGHAVLAYNDKLWVIAGATRISSLTEYNNDVWYSSDGVSWERATASAAFSVRGKIQGVVLKNKMWVIGGKTGEAYRNDIWSSIDGVNWVREASSLSLLGRFEFEAAVFNDKIWIIGGNTGSYASPIYKNDVWSSEDGIKWIEVLGSAPFSPRSGHSTAIFDNKLWVLGGVSSSTSHYDAWSTEDGLTWRRGLKAQIEFP